MELVPVEIIDATNLLAGVILVPQILLYGIYGLTEIPTSCTLLVSVTIRYHGIREVSRISYCSKFTDMPVARGLSGDYTTGGC